MRTWRVFAETVLFLTTDCSQPLVMPTEQTIASMALKPLSDTILLLTV